MLFQKPVFRSMINISMFYQDAQEVDVLVKLSHEHAMSIGLAADKAESIRHSCPRCFMAH